MDKALRISELEELIIKYKDFYYRGEPLVSDFEYDKLEDELKEIDPTNAVLNLVGSKVFSDEKVEHDKKMLSLNKTYKAEELVKWADSKKVLSTFKIDGSSCSIIYKDGNLSISKTRGDGRFGENITKKLLFISHVPKLLSEKLNCEVRGEVYCTEENFVKLSDEMIKLGLERPTSQRNIVAGLLGRKESIHLAKYLNFQAFELFGENLNISSEEEKFHKLQSLGFETPEFYINEDKSDFTSRIEEAKLFMSEGNYLIDGLVFSFNDLKLHESMGETAHHPRYKIAFKFQGETKQTKINSISWQVSRNGILTPVANVEPVDLSGAKVSRVTLHNYGMVKQNSLKEGDIIEIVRSGEVIPKFLSVISSSEKEFTVPSECPSCSNTLKIKEIRLLCDNSSCPDKVKDEILNFIQKIGIEDLSSKRLEEMIKHKIVTDIPSLFNITEENLLSLDKVKEKLAQKILTNIEKSKKANLITVLSSLGISGGAYNKCEKIVVNGYDTIDKVLDLTPAKLELIESFAEKSATDFVNSLKSKTEIINKLKEFGFSFIHESNKGSSINDLKFCITGTLTMKRSELQKIIKNNGGVVQSSVTKLTDYLVTNDTESSSSKFKKAQELNVKIISESELFTLIG